VDTRRDEALDGRARPPARPRSLAECARRRRPERRASAHRASATPQRCRHLRLVGPGAVSTSGGLDRWVTPCAARSPARRDARHQLGLAGGRPGPAATVAIPAASTPSQALAAPWPRRTRRPCGFASPPSRATKSVDALTGGEKSGRPWTPTGECMEPTRPPPGRRALLAPPPASGSDGSLSHQSQ